VKEPKLELNEMERLSVLGEKVRNWLQARELYLMRRCSAPRLDNGETALVRGRIQEVRELQNLFKELGPEMGEALGPDFFEDLKGPSLDGRQ